MFPNPIIIIDNKSLTIKRFVMTPQETDRIYLTAFSKLRHARKHLLKCGLYKYVIHKTVYKTISLLKRYNDTHFGINRHYKKRRRNTLEDHSYNKRKLYVLI